MKLWALILAAGAVIAFAAPAADAATSSAGHGGSARSGNSIQPTGPQTTTVFRDPLGGQTAFSNQLDRPRSPATQALVAGGKLDDLLAPVLGPKVSPWRYLLVGPWSYASAWQKQK